MVRAKGFIYLLIFNILLSGTVTLAVLYLWDKTGIGEKINPATPVVIYIAVTGTPPTPLPGQVGVNDPRTIPTSTVTPTPFELRTEPYRVQPGDSLGTISQRFGISVADLLAVNDLDDPDRLLVGQIILIPLGPLPTNTPFIPTPTITATSTPTPLRSPTPTRTPTRTPNQGIPVLRIESVIGVGDLSTERVRIVHTSGRDTSLEGWSVEDDQGNRYILPRLTLKETGFVTIHTTNGIDTVSNLYWGRLSPVWQPGETARLLDSNGQEVYRYKIP